MKIPPLGVWVRDGHQGWASVQLLLECTMESTSNGKDLPEKTWSCFLPILNFVGLDACI